MSVPSAVTIVPPQSGVAFEMRQGMTLAIVDTSGSQVADVAAFSRADVRESFSSGRTIDYAARITFHVGSILYSNRSNPMFEIVRDDVGRHDCLLSPCSARMFEILRGQTAHPSCHDNLSMALAPYGIAEDAVVSTFNAFMNVRVAEDGAVRIAPPASLAGDVLELRACMDLVVGLAACSSEYTNGGRCAEIAYQVLAHRSGRLVRAARGLNE